MKKRSLLFLSVVLIMALVFALSGGVNAAVSGTCGNDLIWTLDSSGTLTISGSGTMMDWDYSNSAPWNSYQIAIKVVNIDSGVTSIGDYAFSGCSSLTEITIPNSVTSIGNYAFYNCSSLTEITIPEGVTSIGESAFSGCRSLTGILVAVDNPNYSSDEKGVLFNKDQTELIQCPKGKSGDYTMPSSVKTIGDSAFSGCSELIRIMISDSVTSIGDGAFYDCSALTSITIPEGVTSIGNSAFRGCSGLRSITIPEGVTFIGDSAFYNCSGLTEITIPESVTSIGNYAFQYCRSLTEITIPESVTSIGDWAFYMCSGLKSVTILEGVKSIGERAFCGCSSLTSITIPGSVASIRNYAFYGCPDLMEITILEGVTSIVSSAFYGCSGLTWVTIPDSVTFIGKDAFSGCYRITKVYYTGSREQWLQLDIRSGNYGLTNAEIRFNASLGDDDIEILESGTCGDDLTWVLDNHDTLTISGSGAMTDWVSGNSVPWYSSRTSIKSVIIESGVTTVGDRAFLGCSGLMNITLAEDLSSIGTATFYECVNLKSLTIPESVTFIGNWAFQNCTKLTSITIPEGVTSIGNFAFSGCTCLKSITIPDNVTSIGNGLFKDCSSLMNITIPEGVTSIGDYAFDACRSLVMVYYTGSEEQWTQINISDYNDSLIAAKKDFNITPGIDNITTIDGGICGNDIRWILSDSGILTIYGSGAMMNWSIGSYAPWDIYQSSIKRVNIESGVTSIGDDAFSYCSRLTSITIPDSVTSIGDWAFSYCTGLTSITIPEGVTSIGDYAFRDCSKLTSITIPEGVTSIGNYAFLGCTGLIRITIPEGVTSIGSSAFSGCSGLTSITIPNSVTFIGDGAFYNCIGLSNIMIQEGVRTIGGGAFYSCFGLMTVYYTGSEKQWSLINISSGNESLFGAEIIFNYQAVTDVILNKTTLLLKEDDSEILQAMVLPEDAAVKDVTWESDNPSVATVDNTGKVTAIKEGKATITVTTVEANKTATCRVIVEQEHDLVKINAVSATCKTAGNSEYYSCSGCGKYFSDADGTQEIEENSWIIPALGHKAGEAVTENNVPATCEEGGSYEEVVYCSVCSEEMSRKTITVEALGHDWDEGVVTKEATCTEPGVKTFTCKNDDSHKRTEEIPALGHKAGEAVTENNVPATCEEGGSYEEVVYCSVCNAEMSRETKTVEALGHDWDEGVIIKEATATEDGEILYTCKHDPSHTKTEVIPATGPAENPFGDVKETDYFFDAVLWAFGHEPQITKGTDDTHFAPDNTCTRGQVVTFLWRAMGEPEPKTTQNPFSDIKKSDFFYKAVLWAVENDVTSGTGNGKFSPNASCTRGQVVTFLWRAESQPEPKTTKNPFKDVKSDQYYYKAVLWAVENGITTGTSATTFSPAATCTRGQVVTFLYRDLAE